GSGVFFLSSQSGSSQLYRIGPDGGEPVKLTSYPVDIGGYRIGPDGRQVAFHAEVFPDCGADLDCTKQRLDAREANPATGVVYDRRSEERRGGTENEYLGSTNTVAK